MAYIVKRSNGAWEIRESRQTAGGPRSFTLATLREETPEALQRALERSEAGLMESELALKLDEAGVPPTMTNADRAARALLAELIAGRIPSDALRRALVGRLEGRDGFGEKSCNGVDQADIEKQGRLLEDVLDLATALPYEPTAEISQVPLRDLIEKG